jgi:hypothetical protein
MLHRAARTAAKADVVAINAMTAAGDALTRLAARAAHAKETKRNALRSENLGQRRRGVIVNTKSAASTLPLP